MTRAVAVVAVVAAAAALIAFLIATMLAPVIGAFPVAASHVPRDGVATWYDDGPGLYAAAGPALRHGDWRGSRVRVCAGERCITVRLSDWCACGPRGGRTTVLDLSADAFRRLAPLSRGVIRVRVSAPENDGGGRSLANDAVPMPSPLARRSVEVVRENRCQGWVLADGRKMARSRPSCTPWWTRQLQELTRCAASPDDVATAPPPTGGTTGERRWPRRTGPSTPPPPMAR